MFCYHINIIKSRTHWKFFPTENKSEPNSCNIYDRASFSNSELLDVADDCLKVLHPRCSRGSASKYVVTSHINSILQIFFFFNTGFTIFFVPKRAIPWHFHILSLMFLTPIFSIFFHKLHGTSPVAPKTIVIISNVKLGYNLFSSDDNCI